MRTLQDYQFFLRTVLSQVAEKSNFESLTPLEEILKEPKLLVVLNHSTPISWIPAISLLATRVAEAGGAQRTPIGIVDQFFYSNPLTRVVAEYVSQSQVPLRFDELVDLFRSAKMKDLILFPEGARSFFGDLDQIQEFRSSRFVEIALLTQTPILLAVHRGSESWNLEIPIPKEWGAFLSPFSSFFGKGLFENGAINLPLLFKKIPEFRMRVERYDIPLRPEDLAPDPLIRRQQIHQEAEKIRMQMQNMFDELGPVTKKRSVAGSPSDVNMRTHHRKIVNRMG